MVGKTQIIKSREAVDVWFPTMQRYRGAVFAGWELRRVDNKTQCTKDLHHFLDQDVAWANFCHGEIAFRALIWSHARQWLRTADSVWLVVSDRASLSWSSHSAATKFQWRDSSWRCAVMCCVMLWRVVSCRVTWCVAWRTVCVVCVWCLCSVCVFVFGTDSYFRREVVNLASNCPLLQCEPQLSCSARP